MKIEVLPSKISSEVELPFSKSQLHRELILSFLVGKVLTLPSNSEDIVATYNALNVIKSGNGNIYAGESGSTLRLLIPVVLALGGFYVFSGSKRLGERSLDAYFECFEKVSGVLLERLEGNNLPLKVSGKLFPGEYTIDASKSSQFVSGMLLALSALDGDSILHIKDDIVSENYVNITVDMINGYGGKVTRTGNDFHIKGGILKDASYSIEGDYSQAAFFIVMSVLTNTKLTLKPLFAVSKQADKTILNVLDSIGTLYYFVNDALTIIPGIEKGFEIDLKNCPDISIPLMILACFIPFPCIFNNCHRLLDKESDRLGCMIEILNKLGINNTLVGNTLTIIGTRTIQGGITLKTYNDHRFVMGLSTLAISTKKGLIIDGAEAVSKSFPDFFEVLLGLGVSIKGL